MALPAFVELTDAETAFKAGIGQDTGRKIKDDFTNLNSRELKLEGGIPNIDHFNSRDGRFFTVNADEIEDRVGRFHGYRTYGGTGGALSPLWTFPAYSVVRVTSYGGGVAGNNTNLLMTWEEYVFNDVTRPLIYEARVKWRGANNPPSIVIGMADQGLTNGIWLGFPDTTNMRFTSRDASSDTHGSNFTRIAAETWFTVRIEFTDDPSNRALCYVDGVLKSTLTATLPTSRRIAGVIYTQRGSGDANAEVDCDRLDYAPLALGNAA